MISKKIINQIKDLKENEFFLRGIISYIGFKQKLLNLSAKVERLERLNIISLLARLELD